MAHCIYGLGDEYETTNNCGHSLMALDPYLVNATDYCDWRNGGKDPEPQTASTHLQQHNNWDCLKQRWDNYVGYPQTTPDPFYRTCDVDNGQVLNCDHQLLENEIAFSETTYLNLLVSRVHCHAAVRCSQPDPDPEE